MSVVSCEFTAWTPSTLNCWQRVSASDREGTLCRNNPSTSRDASTKVYRKAALQQRKNLHKSDGLSPSKRGTCVDERALKCYRETGSFEVAQEQLSERARVQSSSLSEEVLILLEELDAFEVIRDHNHELVMEVWKMRKVQSSKEKRNSETRGAVALIGEKALRHLCSATARLLFYAPIELLFVTEGTVVPDDVTARHTFVTSHAAMRKLAGLQVLSGHVLVGFVARECAILCLDDIATDPTTWFPEAKRILVLDAVEDPGNMGALLRTASAFGWDAVLLLPGCCDPLSQRASNASRGAHFHLPVARASAHNLCDFAKARGFELLCSCLDEGPLSTSLGEPPFEGRRQAFEIELEKVQDKKGICLVLGNERRGISEEMERVCDRRLCIPMVGHMESLNVSIAGGILLHLLADH